MSKSHDGDPSWDAEAPQDTAARIADQIAPLVRQTRSKGFDFLAYLLGMALKEARRLAEGRNGD
jgi:hypothetical protein